MADYDFLSTFDQGLDTGAGLEGITSQQAPGLDLSGLDTAGGGSGLEDLFADPNFLKMLAGVGSSLSSGQPIGQALGSATQQWIQNQALQKAAGKQSVGQTGFMEQLLSSLRGDPTGKRLLGPKDDMGTLDSINISNDGITMKAPNPDRTVPTFEGTEKSLESITSQKAPELRGSNLPDFSYSQPALTAEMLAGLGPQEIGMLMQAQQAGGSLGMRGLETMLREKSQVRGIDEAERVRQEARKFNIEQAMAQSRAKIAAKEAAVGEKRQTAATLFERQKELASHKAALKAKAGVDGIAPAEQMRIDISQKRLDIAERAEAGDIAYAKAQDIETIMNPDTDRTMAKLKADMSNQDPEGEYVFYEDTTGVNNMDLWKIPSDLLFNGIKVTPPMLVELAKKSGMSFENFIEKMKEQ